MKYKITDLMDLYEDKNCPLTPLDKNMQIIKEEKEIIEVKASKHAFDWKQGLAIAASVALIIAGGFGVKALLNRSNQYPAATLSTTASTVPSVIETTLPTEIQETALPVETNPATEPVVETTAPQVERPSLDEIKLKLNPLLTLFAEQNIRNFDSWTADEEELVNFAQLYFSLHGGKGTKSATLEQLNEFLNKTVGRTVSPEDGASYHNGFISYQNGTFSWSSAAGDQHSRFAVGTVLNNEPYDWEGRIVLSVSFTVYEDLSNLYSYDPAMLELSEEEADAKVESGELGYLSDGQAWVEYVDGELQLVGYELIIPEEIPENMNDQELASELNPLLTAFVKSWVNDSDELGTEEELVKFALRFFHNGKGWVEVTLDELNAFLIRTTGKTVSPEDGTSFNGIELKDGVLSGGVGLGDPSPRFAIGSISGSDSHEENGRLVYDVSFKVYQLADYDSVAAYYAEDGKPVRALNKDEAEELREAGKWDQLLDPRFVELDSSILHLTAEEAEQLERDGILTVYGQGTAKVTFVNGELRIVHYQRQQED